MLDLFAPPSQEEIKSRKTRRCQETGHVWQSSIKLMRDGSGKPIFRCSECNSEALHVSYEEFYQGRS